MLKRLALCALVSVFVIGCSKSEQQPKTEPADSQAPANEEAATMTTASGISAITTRNGHGETAEVGDSVEVHYTGWLYDETEENNRGDKFDSSVDRGERFHFILGAGQVIKGWDEGVKGMTVGEKRELVIPPEMAYGDRDLGVIPPGSTLLFEVELFGVEEMQPRQGE